jgi:hypothetical protein
MRKRVLLPVVSVLVLLLSVRSERCNHTFVQWRDIANAQPGSALHNDIVRWANRVKSLGNHVYFTFNHEPETALNSSGTGADFIAAWRKVITVFRAQGSPTPTTSGS